MENLTGGSYNITIFFPGDKKYANSTVTTTIFALVAQIERDLISLRTIEALITDAEFRELIDYI